MNAENTGSVRNSLDHILFSNPVLVGGLVIGQLAAGARSLQCAAALSITFLFVTLPVLVFASVIGKRLPKLLRVVFYMIISGGMLLPSYLVCREISPTLIDSVGIYLPLIAVTTIPVAYSAKFSERHDVRTAFLDGLGLSAGFAAVALLLGAAREFFGNGTLWGTRVIYDTYPAVLLPFWGFILLGFMSAGVSALRDIYGLKEYTGFAVREEDEK